MADYQKACVAGLEVHVFGGDGGADRPLVFVTHGRTGHIGHTHPLARKLAAAGLTAVGVEERNHGRRLVDPAANGQGPHHASDLYGLIVGMAFDLSLLIDFLPARLGLSTARVGVTGVSLGGHAALAAMALDPRIRVGAPLISSGDFRTLMESRFLFPEFEGLSWDEFFPPALAAAVERHDPIRHPEVFADRPLLMLNGGADTLVPLVANQGLERALRPHYRRAEDLELRVAEGLGHVVTPEMEDQAVGWLKLHLV